MGPTSDDTLQICENMHRQCLIDTLLGKEKPRATQKEPWGREGDT